MYTSLSPGAIGVHVDDLEAGLSLAAKHGFAGYHFDVVEAAEFGVERVLFHVHRLQPAAQILAAHDICLGLEYVGPLTSREGRCYPFIHTMDQMAQLCAAVGADTGYLLDAWHWYTAGEDRTHLQRLQPLQVVDVHVNDAPDKAVDAQIDDQRELPGATGVIDIATFLSSLQRIGYDGPVMVEPFSAAVREMSADEACAATAEALSAVMPPSLAA